MAAKYRLTPTQVAVLRAIKSGIVGISTAEIAVNARLLPNQVNSAITELTRLGLASSSVAIAVTRQGGSDYILAGEGQNVLNAISQFRDIPSVGTIVQLPRALPVLSRFWNERQGESYVEIVTEPSEVLADAPGK